MTSWTAVLLPALLLGQAPPRELAHFLAAARAHNHALQISKAQLAEQEAMVDLAFAAAFAPTLRAAGDYTRNEYQASFSLPASFFGGPPNETQPLTIQPFNAWTASVGINLPVLAAGSFFRYQEQQHGREAVALAERATDADVLLSTARAYYRVVGAQGVVAAGMKALTTAQDNLEVTRVKYGAGTQTRLAVDRAQVDVARAQQTIVTSRQALALAARNLETLTGEKLVGDLPPPEEHPGMSEKTEEAWVAEAEQARPEIRQAEEALRQQELVLRESWAQLTPALGGNFTESFTNITGFTGQTSYWTAGVNLAVTLDPFSTRAAVHRAHATIEEARQRLAQTEDSVRDEVHAAWLDVDADLARVKQSADESKSAADALGITQQQYAVGTATSLDVSQAQRDAFNSEASLAQSQADLAAALLALRKAAGEDLLPDSEGTSR